MTTMYLTSIYITIYSTKLQLAHLPGRRVFFLNAQLRPRNMKPWDTQIVQHHLQAWKHGNCDKAMRHLSKDTSQGVGDAITSYMRITGLQYICAHEFRTLLKDKPCFYICSYHRRVVFRGEEILKHRQPKYPLICTDGHLTCSLSHFTRHWFEHSRWWFILPSCTMSSQIFHIFLFFQGKVSANWHRFLYENNAAVQAPHFLNHVQVVRYHQASGGGSSYIADHLRCQFYWWPSF